jgi:hypothetical protein
VFGFGTAIDVHICAGVSTQHKKAAYCPTAMTCWTMLDLRIPHLSAFKKIDTVLDAWLHEHPREAGRAPAAMSTAALGAHRLKMATELMRCLTTHPLQPLRVVRELKVQYPLIRQELAIWEMLYAYGTEVLRELTIDVSYDQPEDATIGSTISWLGIRFPRRVDTLVVRGFTQRATSWPAYVQHLILRPWSPVVHLRSISLLEALSVDLCTTQYADGWYDHTLAAFGLELAHLKCLRTLNVRLCAADGGRHAAVPHRLIASLCRSIAALKQLYAVTVTVVVSTPSPSSSSSHAPDVSIASKCPMEVARSLLEWARVHSEAEATRVEEIRAEQAAANAELAAVERRAQVKRMRERREARSARLHAAAPVRFSRATTSTRSPP